jgi:hypothetical protein
MEHVIRAALSTDQRRPRPQIQVEPQSQGKVSPIPIEAFVKVEVKEMHFLAWQCSPNKRVFGQVLVQRVRPTALPAHDDE